jgi:lipopolysaccharide export system permease protein
MRLIDRYMFRQLLGPTLAATAALAAVLTLSQTLTFLDILVGQKQGVLVFAKVILLTLPQMLALVLPIAVFIAALMTLNRLHIEQEIIVCYAGGMSLWQVTAPAFRLATLAALISLLVNLWGQPVAMRALRDELFRVRTDLAASLVREGEFNTPAAGLTVYAQSVDSEGLLKNVFIHQDKPGGESSVFTADRGLVTTRGDSPVMILRNGSNQQVNDKGVLNYVLFSEYVFDLSLYTQSQETVSYKMSDRFLHELLAPDTSNHWDKLNKTSFLAEAHYRLSSPIYVLTFMALAIFAVLGGAFSRIGYTRRIALIGALAGAVRIMGFAVQSASVHTPVLNVLQYVVPILPIVLIARALYGKPKAAGGDLVALTPLGLSPQTGRV